MKTTPELRGFGGQRWAVLAVGGLLVLASGCAFQRTTQLKRAPFSRPPVMDAETIIRNEVIENRAHELLATGKYKRIENARVAAEKETPRVIHPAQQEWSTEQARWQQQKQAQEKFQTDFAKSRSGS